MPEEVHTGEGASLLDHLEAFRWTLIWCLAAVAVCAVPGIIFIPDLLLRYVRFVCPPGMEMHYFTPFEPLMVQLELGFISGAVAALPFILYKLAGFISPGLYYHERRWSFFFLITSTLLMSCGIAAALVVVVPVVMKFSWEFAADGLRPVIGLSAFLHFSGLLAAGFAVIFELPAALLLAIRFGIVSVDTLRKKRPVIIVTLFIVAAVLTPPDVVSQLLMGLPGWILFEVTLLIGDRIAPRKDDDSSDSEDSLWVRNDSGSSRIEQNSDGQELSEPSQSSSEPYVDDTPYRSAARKKRKIRHL